MDEGLEEEDETRVGLGEHGEFLEVGVVFECRQPCLESFERVDGVPVQGHAL